MTKTPVTLRRLWELCFTIVYRPAAISEFGNWTITDFYSGDGENYLNEEFDRPFLLQFT